MGVKNAFWVDASDGWRGESRKDGEVVDSVRILMDERGKVYEAEILSKDENGQHFIRYGVPATEFIDAKGLSFRITSAWGVTISYNEGKPE